MDRESLRGFLSIGIFVGGGGFLLALVQPRDSAEFVVSICSGVIGIMLIGLILFLNRIMS